MPILRTCTHASIFFFPQNCNWDTISPQLENHSKNSFRGKIIFLENISSKFDLRSEINDWQTRWQMTFEENRGKNSSQTAEQSFFFDAFISWSMIYFFYQWSDMKVWVIFANSPLWYLLHFKFISSRNLPPSKQAKSLTKKRSRLLTLANWWWSFTSCPLKKKGDV